MSETAGTTQMNETGETASTTQMNETGETASTTDRAIIDPETNDRLESRWNDIQPRFVDDPRDAVADADQLVTDTIEAITSSLDADRSRLEEHWQEGRDPSTEDLRNLMQRYRDLFSRLLDV